MDSPGKIKSLDQIGAVADAIRAEGRSITLCHGVFDLLHVGHLRHLRVARGFGDALIVSITADEFVQKGPGRPVFQSMLRAEMLAALEIVDHVVVVYDPSAEPILHAVKPDVYAKGGDYIDETQDVTGKIVREIPELGQFVRPRCKCRSGDRHTGGRSPTRLSRRPAGASSCRERPLGSRVSRGRKGARPAPSSFR